MISSRRTSTALVVLAVVLSAPSLKAVNISGNFYTGDDSGAYSATGTVYAYHLDAVGAPSLLGSDAVSAETSYSITGVTAPAANSYCMVYLDIAGGANVSECMTVFPWVGAGNQSNLHLRTGYLRFNRNTSGTVSALTYGAALGQLDGGTNSSQIVSSASSTSIVTNTGIGLQVKWNWATGMTLSSGGTLTVNGPIVIDTGCTLSAGGADAISCTGDFTNNGTFTKQTSTFTFNGTTTISGTATTSFHSVTVNATKSLTGHATLMRVSGAWTINGSFTPNGGTVQFNGTAASALSGANGGTFYSFHNNGVGVTTALVTLTVAGNWTNSSTVTMSDAAAEVQFTGASAQTIITGGIVAGQKFPKLAMSGAGTKTLSTNDMKCDGAVTVAAGTGGIDLGGRTFYIWGDFIVLSTNAITNGTIEFTGSAATLASAATLPNVTINSTGTKTLVSATYNYDFIVTGVLTITAGTLQGDSDTSVDLEIRGNFVNNGTYSNNGGNLLFASTTVLSGTGSHTFMNVVITGTFTAPSGTMTVSGTWTNTSGTFVHNSGTVVFNGAATAIGAGGIGATKAFYNVTINANVGASKTITSDMDIDGNLVLNQGTLACGAGMTITVGGNWSINGGWFTANTGTVRFDGTNTQTVSTTASTTIFNNLEIANTHATAFVVNSTGMWDIDGALTINDGTMQVANVAGTDLDVDGNVTIALNAGLNLTAGNLAIFLGGSFTNNNTSSYGANRGVDSNSTDLVTFDATAAGKTIQGRGVGGVEATEWPPVTFNGAAAATWTLSSAMTVSGNLTITLGTLNGGGQTLSVSGNWSCAAAATFTHASSTVSLNGTSAQNITTNGDEFGALSFYGSGLKTFLDSTAWNGASAINSGATLTIANLVTISAKASLTISGRLLLPASTKLSMSNGTSITVASAGTLDIRGTSSSGDATAGVIQENAAASTWSIVLSDSCVLDARGARFIGGVISQADWTPAPAEITLSDVRFYAMQTGQGNVYLDLSSVDRGIMQFSKLHFSRYDTSGALPASYVDSINARNIKADTSTLLVFVNGYTGDLAGEAFDSDPSNRIRWSGNSIPLKVYDGVSTTYPATLEEALESAGAGTLTISAHYTDASGNFVDATASRIGALTLPVFSGTINLDGFSIETNRYPHHDFTSGVYTANPAGYAAISTFGSTGGGTLNLYNCMVADPWDNSATGRTLVNNGSKVSPAGLTASGDCLMDGVLDANDITQMLVLIGGGGTAAEQDAGDIDQNNLFDLDDLLGIMDITGSAGSVTVNAYFCTIDANSMATAGFSSATSCIFTRPVTTSRYINYDNAAPGSERKERNMRLTAVGAAAQTKVTRNATYTLDIDGKTRTAGANNTYPGAHHYELGGATVTRITDLSGGGAAAGTVTVNGQPRSNSAGGVYYIAGSDGTNCYLSILNRTTLTISATASWTGSRATYCDYLQCTDSATKFWVYVPYDYDGDGKYDRIRKVLHDSTAGTLTTAALWNGVAGDSTNFGKLSNFNTTNTDITTTGWDGLIYFVAASVSGSATEHQLVLTNQTSNGQLHVFYCNAASTDGNLYNTTTFTTPHQAAESYQSNAFSLSPNMYASPTLTGAGVGGTLTYVREATTASTAVLAVLDRVQAVNSINAPINSYPISAPSSGTYTFSADPTILLQSNSYRLGACTREAVVHQFSAATLSTTTDASSDFTASLSGYSAPYGIYPTGNAPAAVSFVPFFNETSGMGAVCAVEYKHWQDGDTIGSANSFERLNSAYTDLGSKLVYDNDGASTTNFQEGIALIVGKPTGLVYYPTSRVLFCSTEAGMVLTAVTNDAALMTSLGYTGGETSGVVLTVITDSGHILFARIPPVS